MGKNRKLFLVDHCYTPLNKIYDSGILCEENRIIAIGGASAISQEEPGLQVFNLPNAYAMPGLIDSHVHGGGGFDTENALEEGQNLRNLSSYLASRGVTTYLPTLSSMPREKMIALTDRLSSEIRNALPEDGANPAALHLEGPFINEEKSGAQYKEAFSPVDLGYARELIETGHGKVKLMTFAPELPNADKLVELMLENGVIPSMGHSMANAEQAIRAIDAGAHRCTHLFNALPLLHHRRSSITDVVLTRNEVAVELILDGAHIDPSMVYITSKVKPNDKLIGISNAVERSSLLKRGLVEKKGFFYTKIGNLAGTSTPLDCGWKHLTQYSNMAGNTCVAAFTSNPAKDIGLVTRGEITPGKRADITFFDTDTDTVVMTVSNGKIIYQAPEGE